MQNIKQKPTCDVILLQKQSCSGLTMPEILQLQKTMKSVSQSSEFEVFPIDLEAMQQECAALGFIKTSAAELLDYDYKTSGFHNFIATILDDIEVEKNLKIDTYGNYNIYQFCTNKTFKLQNLYLNIWIDK